MMPGVQKPHWLPPVVRQRLSPARGHLGVEPVEGGDRAAGHASGRGDAGHPGLAVDQHRAAAALALGAAAVLGRANAQVLAQDVEQAHAAVGHLHLPTVDHQLQDRWRFGRGQLKD